MLSANVLSSIFLFLGLAMAAPSPSAEVMAQAEARAELDTRACVINGEDCHGERTCIAGGISCEYADGSKYLYPTTLPSIYSRTEPITSPQPLRDDLREKSTAANTHSSPSPGRCAKLSATDGSFTAWCPNGHWDKGVYHDIYTGAGCISAFTALGRHSC